MKTRTWISKPDVFVASEAAKNNVFDFSGVEHDEESLFLQSGSKSRWLITTSVAGIAGAVVIGAALVGTFGFGGIEGPAIAAQHSASLWQRPSSARKGDRASAISGVIGRSQIAEVIAERSYRKITVEFDKANLPDKKSAPPGTPELAGSLAPEYQVAAANAAPSKVSVNITSAIPAEPAGKPTVLNTTARSQQLAALDPRDVTNTTTVAKTSNVSHTEELEETVEVEKGDTLLKLLTERGTPRSKTREIIAAFKKSMKGRELTEGHKVHITYDNVVDKKGYETLRPIRLAVMPSTDQEFAVVLGKNGRYRPESSTGKLTHRAKDRNADRFRARARIRKSLYFAAKDQGIPERVIVEMMRVHAYDVDFQREVQPGDSFEVFYDAPNDPKSRRRRGAVLYSALTLKTRKRGYYRFTTPDDGITDYYDANGRSATKFLMRTPLNGARITSGFGLRRHPTLGYTKMHTGVDFAAPYGTPVKAAGHGIIEKIGRVGAYGKYIRIRHANGYKTAYAHMSRYASGLKEGMKIQQDQVIGYVGSTGRSTGAHLHYEIIVNERHVNPMKLRMPTGRRLTGTVMQSFLKQKRRIDRLMRAAPVSTQVAAAKK